MVGGGEVEIKDLSTVYIPAQLRSVSSVIFKLVRYCLSAHFII